MTIANEILMHFRASKKNQYTVSLNDSIGFDKEGNEINLEDLIEDKQPDIIDTIHNKNNIELNIYLSYKEDDEKKKLQPILRSSYEFKRGYDTRGTKRYKVYYQVNCYFCL